MVVVVPPNSDAELDVVVDPKSDGCVGAGAPNRLVEEKAPNWPVEAGAGDPKALPPAGAGAGVPNMLPEGAPNKPPPGAGGGVPKAGAGAGVEPNKDPPAGAGEPKAGAVPPAAAPPMVWVVLGPHVTILSFTKGF